MKDAFQATVEARLSVLSRAANAVAIVLGALILCGWGLDYRPLLHVFPTVVGMNPTTAMGLLLAGVALWNSPSTARVPKGRRRIGAAVLGALVACLGGLRLVDLLFGLGLGIDQVLFSSRLDHGTAYPPGEMASNTALDFVLIGGALVLLNTSAPRTFSIAQALAVVAGWIGLLAMIGYTYHVILFYRLGSGLPMALDTAVGFGLLCLSFLTAWPGRGVLAVITSRTTGGAMARRLLPMAILVPWGLGGMLLVAEQAGYFGKEFAVSVFAVLTIILFASLLWWNARLLYCIDLDRLGAEAQLRSTSADLQRSNTDLQQFAHMASHDLFEPLRMVTSYLQLLEHKHKNRLDPQGLEFLGFAIEGARRMEALIQDLLEYSRVDVRAYPFQPTDCEQVLAAALANLKVALEESGAEVIHDPLPTVLGDRVQLTQLFQNLIGNAIKFRGAAPSRIEVRVQLKVGEWLFLVRDNGIGIDPKDFARIFIIFQRLHTRQQYPGTGMGLAICKKIVERHGGRIWVESLPGQGSSFYFTLPVAGAGGPGAKDQ